MVNSSEVKPVNTTCYWLRISGNSSAESKSKINNTQKSLNENYHMNTSQKWVMLFLSIDKNKCDCFSSVNITHGGNGRPGTGSQVFNFPDQCSNNSTILASNEFY